MRLGVAGGAWSQGWRGEALHGPHQILVTEDLGGQCNSGVQGESLHGSHQTVPTDDLSAGNATQGCRWCLVSGLEGEALQRMQGSSGMLLEALKKAACSPLTSCKIHGEVCTSSHEKPLGLIPQMLQCQSHKRLPKSRSAFASETEQRHLKGTCQPQQVPCAATGHPQRCFTCHMVQESDCQRDHTRHACSVNDASVGLCTRSCRSSHQLHLYLLLYNIASSEGHEEIRQGSCSDDCMSIASCDL